MNEPVQFIGGGGFRMTLIARIPLGEQQRVAIARAVASQADTDENSDGRSRRAKPRLQNVLLALG